MADSLHPLRPGGEYPTSVPLALRDGGKRILSPAAAPTPELKYDQIILPVDELITYQVDTSTGEDGQQMSVLATVIPSQGGDPAATAEVSEQPAPVTQGGLPETAVEIPEPLTSTVQ